MKHNPAMSLPQIKLKGYLGERLDAMIRNHVIGTDVDYLTAVFREKTERCGWWQTEFWGKYMHSAVPYSFYVHSGKLESDIDRGVRAIIASQEADGYIGNYPDELRFGEGWDVWGVKYTLLGLLHAHDLRGDAEILNAAKKLCDCAIAELGPKGKRGRELWTTGNWSGYASSSILEPVVWLYRVTNEKKYLDFASCIAKGMTEAKKGPRLLDLALAGVSVADRNEPDYKDEFGDWTYVCKHNRWKAYEMMSCYQGMLEYFEAVGGAGKAKDFLKAAVMTGEDIIREEINLAGGCACSEAWFHGARKQHLPYIRLQETCVTTTWMRFCEKLLEMTGDPKWADQIERTFYNAYLGAMKADGKEFAGYTPLTGNRYHGQHHCFMHTDCCTANGPRGFLCFLREMCVLGTERSGGEDVPAATFNFYGSATFDGFDMYSLYPRENSVRITSHVKGRRILKFRIPAWSAKTTVSFNGKTLKGVKAGTYFTIDRTLKLGDIIELAFDMPVVAHRLESNIAFTRGPVLLARDSRFGDGELSAVFRNGGTKTGDVMPSFTAVRVPTDAMWMAFSATLPLDLNEANPEGANPQTVFFCDYASAGNEWSVKNHYRTWFPVALGPTE